MVDFRNNPEWLDDFRSGKREALERVYRAYVRGIESYLRRLARSNASSELAQSSAVADFLQDVFVRAFAPAARRSYDGVRDYGAYLTTIARNCFIDALRARGREVLQTQEQWLSRIDDVELGHLDNGVDPRVQSTLTRYLAGLDPDLESVYRFRFERGQSQEETCAALGISRGILRTREDHLRRGLRKALVRAGVTLSELKPTTGAIATLAARLPNARNET